MLVLNAEILDHFSLSNQGWANVANFTLVVANAWLGNCEVRLSCVEIEWLVVNS